MAHDFYLAFGKVAYPCYWYGNDSKFFMNGAALKASPPLNNLAAMRKILSTASRELQREEMDGAYNLPLLTGALHPRTLTVMSQPDGLLAVVAHEGNVPVASFSNQLRESLTNVFSVLPLLAKKLEGNDVKYVEEVQNNCYSMLRLASNLENASQIERGKIENTLLDFAELVESICICTSSVCREQGIRLNKELPSQPVPVMGDAQLLSNMLLNLLRNSMQYTRDGNSITVKLYERAGRAILTVEDNGLGIQPENIQKIFDPYFSTDPYGDNNIPPGLGLGLSLVREAVRSCGGTVTAESRFGQGTRITIALPIAQDTEGTMLNSDPADYLLNRYSPVYVQLSGYCRLPEF